MTPRSGLSGGRRENVRGYRQGPGRQGGGCRGFPDDPVVKNPPANAGGVRTWVQSLGKEDPLEEGMATHSSILA